MSPLDPLFQVLSMIGIIMKYALWIILPFGLYAIFRPLWQAYTTNVLYFGEEINLTLLRIRISKDMIANPKAMENALAGLLASYRTITFYQQLMKGRIFDFFSLEIASNEGDVGFYVLTPERSIRLVEKFFYANFPEIEIEVGVEDYFNKLPKTIDENWSMWGAKMILDKPDSVPITTYPSFEDKIAGEIMDPLATIFEAMGTLGPGEHLIYQIQIGQPDFEWRKKGEAEIEKILAKYNMSADADLSTEGTLMKILPHHQLELAKSIHYKLDKAAFNAQVLFAYIARKESFNGVMPSTISGAMKQFESGNNNGFGTDKYYTTSTYFLLSKERGSLRRKRLLRLMQDRDMQGVINVLNVEELATLFHFPTPMTKVPSIPRMDSKRAPAPPNLPVSE